MGPVRQNFPRIPPLDIHHTIGLEFQKIRSRISSGARIAVAVGSRGIANLPSIVARVLDHLKAAGAKPFIIPAMGSHGGATPEGQTEVLSAYGITEETMNVPIAASLQTRQIGTSHDGVPVFCGIEALQSDGIILINRVKPHTDFSGTLGSGILKMSVIGLGKRDGAVAMHTAATRLGHERAIRGIAEVMLGAAPILGGVALVEDQFHNTAKLRVLPREEIEAGENELFLESRRLLPRLPFQEIDLLIIDRIGKNISGAGMDPNVTGRWVQGYLSSLVPTADVSPFIRRVFVRDLTPETHGNAIGIGLADVTTSRLVRAMDSRVTYVNALTAMTPQCAKIPIHFETDREAIELILTSLAMIDFSQAKVVRISDTLSMSHFEISEAFMEETKKRNDIEAVGAWHEMTFGPDGNLNELRC